MESNIELHIQEDLNLGYTVGDIGVLKEIYNHVQE